MCIILPTAVERKTDVLFFFKCAVSNLKKERAMILFQGVSYWFSFTWVQGPKKLSSVHVNHFC